VPSGGGAFWCQRIECDPLAGAAPIGWRCASEAARRRSVVASYRAARRPHPGSACRDARHHPAGAEGAAGAVWRAVERRRALALLQASQADAQKKTAHASEQDRPDVLRRREDWFESQLDLDPERLVFIDETWTSTNMARTHGRCARGERLRVGVPHGHWKTTTFVAGLRISGIMAPFVLDGPINRNAFETYVEKVLVRELLPGDIVMMDNLSSHKGPAVRAMIEAVGASLFYLPPYSPDFNPIEKAFSKLKAHLRKAAERTVAGLWDAIGRLIDLFTPQECTNFFAAAGYDAT